MKIKRKEKKRKERKRLKKQPKNGMLGYSGMFHVPRFVDTPDVICVRSTKYQSQVLFHAKKQSTVIKL